MDKLKIHIQSLMKRLLFPDDARLELEAAYDAMQGPDFSRLIARYQETENCDYKALLSDVTAIGGRHGIHPYTASLLLFLCFSEVLLERYRIRGIEESIYYCSMADLAYKLEECRLVHGINGSFVASWFSGFFALTRFGLGRLQFELVKTAENHTVDGKIVLTGSKAINVHIPRTGTRLDHTLVQEAYRSAAEFFSPMFQNEPILFHCKSWLLDPWNLTVLKPESNLSVFIRDFEIVQTGSYDDYKDLWRLFDCKYEGDASTLPRNSSLRCAYADRVARGEPIGWGLGMFFY